MTPKTLDKYIAALKKKAAAEGWTPAQYKDELDKMQSDMVKQFLSNKITGEEYAKVTKQFENALKNPGLLGKQKTVMQTAPASDPGQQTTDKAVQKLENELKKIYTAAAKEMKAELKKLLEKYSAQLTEKQQALMNGEITQAQYSAWVKSQMLQQKAVKEKIDQLTGVTLNANEKAMAMINGETLNVFAENANWQSYQLTKDTGMNISFSIYDEHTAKKLIMEKPELLPRKMVNGKKDKAWNQKIIANAVTQAVLQGESIDKLANRIAVQTGETNMKAMVRYARTAMTGAQNSGRMEMLHRAKDMGIKCKKRWIATLDNRTRDSHQHLDGETVEVDDEFSNGLEYPGDPDGAPAEVYNCRCTLGYEYEGYPADPEHDERRDNESGDVIANMDYDEWKAAKEGSALNELNSAKFLLAETQKAVQNAKVDESKVYSGIWKEDVTLADYPDKKGSVQAKRDYYGTGIQKYKDAISAGSHWATPEKLKDLEKKLKLLNEFEKKGKLLEKRNAALAKVQEIYKKIGYGKTAAAPAVAQKAKNKAKKAAQASGGTNTGAAGQTAAGLNLGAAGAMKTPFGPEAYTQERKDKALWTTNKKKVDSMMRSRTGEVWSAASDLQKDAIYEYTQSFSKFNEPLRGIEYGTNRYLGVGKTDLNAGARRNGRFLNAMTEIIDKCSYDHDQWLQRGVGFGGMDKFFNCSPDLLRYGTEKELQNALLGTTPTEYGFMSMGSAKGNGFSGNILLNIYAPSGTKMMYVEPFSAYSGSYAHRSWDGKSAQTNFGHEFETIMQQGTQFRVTKVEKTNGKIYIDMEVINQDRQQRWK